MELQQYYLKGVSFFLCLCLSPPLAGDELMRCVDLYNQAQSKWFEEMVTTSLVRKPAIISSTQNILHLFCSLCFTLATLQDCNKIYNFFTTFASQEQNKIIP